MGAPNRILRFFGFGAQAEIAQKTFGQTFRVNDGQRLREEATKLLWACMVLGDRLFPRLRGKRIGRFHIGGAIVLALASIVPMLLLFRFGHRLCNHVPARHQRVDAAHVETIPSSGGQDGNGD